MLNIFMKVGFIICILLLIINVLSVEIIGTTENTITFTYMLDYLDKCPTLDLTIGNIHDSMTITADWGVFNGFRDFLNLFSYALSFIAWIGVMFYNLLVIISFFLTLIGFQAFGFTP